MQDREAVPTTRVGARVETSYRMLPDWLTFGVSDDGRPLVSGEALRLYAALRRHENDTTGQCNPSIPLLAAELCCDRTTVMRLTRELEAAGAIEVDRTRRSNSYRIAFDPVQPVTLIGRNGATRRIDATSRGHATTTSRTDATNISRTDATQTKALERKKENENDDDARENGEINAIADETRELRDTLVADLRPSATQRALLDEGLMCNPDAIRACVEIAREGDRPAGLFFHELEKAKADGWLTPTIGQRNGKRGLTATEIAAKAVALDQEQEQDSADAKPRTISIFQPKQHDAIEVARGWWNTVGRVYPDGRDELAHLFPRLTPGQIDEIARDEPVSHAA
jgi:hypothetical protein